MSKPPSLVSLTALTRVFGKIGLLSFGGPAAQIALLQRETVDRCGWLDESRFLRGLGFCMMLPGPEAMQMATYIGWSLRGVPGGLIAGGLFVLPGAFVIAMLSYFYITFGAEPIIQKGFIGIKSAVLAIVIAAMARLSRKALGTGESWAMALLAFAALFAFGLPFPAVVAAAALWGCLRPQRLTTPPAPMPHPRHSLRTILVWSGLWAAPLILLSAFDQALLFDLALFFGKLAITTFGGAYAVLAYMTQTVVADHGWVSTDQMLDALGLAETTPGPLILVTQFVGHLAGHGQGGWPLWLAAGALTLWMTFTPCFIWIFAGAPYLEAITTRPRIAGALKAITAAIVGVMASLSLWFALNVLFTSVTQTAFGPATLPSPAMTSFSPPAILCFATAGYLLWHRGWSVPATLALSTGLALAFGAGGL